MGKHSDGRGMPYKKGENVKTLIGIPCMDSIPTVTVKSLVGLSFDNGDVVEMSFTMNSLVYDARNSLAQKACENGYDRIMFIDSDMIFEEDLYKRLSARLDEGYDFMTGIYFTRRTPILPVIYSDVYMENNTPTAVEFKDYPKDSIFKVSACGFGGCMMTTKMLLDIAKKYGLPFSPILGFSEDLSFCIRAREAGYNLFCDSSIKMGHKSHCIVTEAEYLKGE